MVAMVNHTAVAALHRERTHGDGGHASGVEGDGGGEGGVDLQGGGGGVGGLQGGDGGGVGLQENSSTSPGDQVDDKADGPFVWETTVSLTDLQKTDQNQIFFRNKVMCSVHTLLGTL